MKLKSFYLLAFVIVLFSCNSIPDHAKYIPKDAQLVGTIDMSKLTKKLIWNALTGSDLFKEMQKRVNNEDSKNAMKDISNIGLKQNSSIYFYLNGHKSHAGSSCIVIGMDDATKFESFLKKNYPQISMDKGTGYTSAMIENSMLAAWNKEVALFYPLMNGYASDSLNIHINMNDVNEIKTGLTATFAQSTGNSIASNAHFKSLQKEGHDISVWMNYEELYNKNADASSNPFIKADYFKESGVTAGIDFEKGKASTEMNYFMSDDLASIYKKNAPKNIDLDLVKRIPSKDIAVLVGYNMNPKLIQEYLKKFGLDGMLNMGLGMAGTSMDQIAGTFTGDLVFALSDMKAKVDTINSMNESDYEPIESKAPEMNMTFAMGLKDSKDFEKLLGIGVKNNVLQKNGNTYSLGAGPNEAGFAFDKERMVYTSDAAMSAAYLSGGGNGKEAIPSSVWSHFSSNPMIMYADMKKIMNSVSFKPTNPEETELMNDLKKFFTYIEFYGGSMKNNAVHVEGALFLANENENALIQLLDLGMKAKKLNDSKNAEVPAVDSMEVQ